MICPECGQINGFHLPDCYHSECTEFNWNLHSCGPPLKCHSCESPLRTFGYVVQAVGGIRRIHICNRCAEKVQMVIEILPVELEINRPSPTGPGRILVKGIR